jgi:hypothetical protein
MGIDRETGFGKALIRLLKHFFLTPEEGAQTAVFLATSPAVEKVTGKYYYKEAKEKTSRLAKSKSLAEKLFVLSENITDERLINHLPIKQ